MSAIQESALSFDCRGEPLIGIVSRPVNDTLAPLGVVIVVGGPQYRVGSHRQFVLLARHLAAAGHAVLRFDYRGMGDSSGSVRDFREVDDDINAAIDALSSAVQKLRGVVLWGLCDAASAVLLFLNRRPDPRVRGVVLANPWVRSAQSLAQTHVKHYYWQRLRQPEFWLKLLSGRVGLPALKGLASNVQAARGQPIDGDRDSFQSKMASGLRGFAGPCLLVLSSEDYTAKEFVDFCNTSPAWIGLLSLPGVTHAEVSGADHTFSAPAHARQVDRLTVEWLEKVASAP